MLIRDLPSIQIYGIEKIQFRSAGDNLFRMFLQTIQHYASDKMSYFELFVVRIWMREIGIQAVEEIRGRPGGRV